MKNILKMLFGGDFQSGVYAKGGSIKEADIKVGEKFKLINGEVIEIKRLFQEKHSADNNWVEFTRNGKSQESSVRSLKIFINNWREGKSKYDIGGSITNERRYVNKGEDYEVRYSKPRPKRKGYKGLRSFDNGGGIDHKDTWQNLLEDFGFKKGRSKYGLEMYYKRGYTASVDKNLRNVDLMFEDDVLYKGYSVQGLLDALEKQFGKRSFDDGGNIDLNDDKKLRVRKPVMPKRKFTEAEWMAKHNDSKEARTYGFGGLFSKSGMMSRPKAIDLNQEQVRLKSGEYVQVLNHQGDSLMVMELSKLGTGASPKYVRLSDVDMTSLAKGGGVGLIGNQKRIDMNKNGKIDAEDFKLLRSSMNGAWRNERKHVNHNEDYEVRYARKKPARTGYKGKRKFGEGGGISNFERLSRVVAKNYEGKRVKPQYQKDYGKVYSKSEAKEVGNKVAGKMKMMKKAESGAEVKKTNRGGVMVLAKKIRKDGESWKDALKRAGQQLK